MCLLEVTLKEADLLDNMLEGGIRSNQRHVGHSIYVDVVLTESVPRSGSSARLCTQPQKRQHQQVLG
jgi:hypothetical protein